MDSVKCYLFFILAGLWWSGEYAECTCSYVTLFSYDVCQVVTFWEGEIVDGKNYTFFTGKWEASYVS
jgi:hypothetical protein